MLIENIPELKNCLNKEIILLTGAGGGIGFEAAKAFAYMGANVIIAEINKDKGLNAEKSINELIERKLVEYYKIDLSNETQIKKMINYINKKYGYISVVFNNATITNMGSIDEISVKSWDNSYAVNLKAPFVLVNKILPMMKANGKGTVVFVSSSGAAPYMGAYEIFKIAQVELSNTLAMELGSTGIYTYTIAPGLVKTQTAMKAIEIVSSKMGMSIDEFYTINESILWMLKAPVPVLLFQF